MRQSDVQNEESLKVSPDELCGLVGTSFAFINALFFKIYVLYLQLCGGFACYCGGNHVSFNCPHVHARAEHLKSPQYLIFSYYPRQPNETFDHP